jgi:diguanylate cyclase (GGDEF)-like protein
MNLNIHYRHRPESSVLRFLATDSGKIVVLASAILLLAAVGAGLSHVVVRRMLRFDAQQTALDWSASVTRNADSLPALLAALTPPIRAAYPIDEVTRVSHIYRFRLWDSHGQLVFAYDSRNSPLKPHTIEQRYGQKIAGSIFAGKVFTEATAGTRPENPPYFGESYIPIVRDHAVIGVFETYVDETLYNSLCEKTFLLAESITAIAVLLAGGLPGFLAWRRMMDHRKAKAEAVFLAKHDSLTGIANRQYLEEAGKQALARCRRDNNYLAVIIFDLERFKEVNDSFGHSAGDELLKLFAIRLKAIVREGDTVARLGGDEFVILQVSDAVPSAISAMTERLLKNLLEPYEIGGLSIECGVNVGIAISPNDAEDWDALLSCADVALAKAKAEGRNAVCFFQPGMDVLFRKRRQIEVDLRRALQANALQLAYQPQFGAENGILIGFEALLRWPDGWNYCSPADFIPVAEESGLIVAVGSWVLETACRAAVSWKTPVKVAVNLSPVQFSHGNIVAVVTNTLEKTGLDPSRLELEVTESVWLEGVDSVVQRLQALRKLGVSIALDDFGTGYSSLTYLLKFPFDKVKIDRSFVTDMMTRPKAAAIVNTIVALGKILGLTITAEGVEEPVQAQALTDAGCDQMQGYLFGRPMSPLAAADLAAQSLSLAHSASTH